jgi:tRNA dimethylallyltransferase
LIPALSSDSKTNPANPLLVILGPTASGKTRLAVGVAGRLDGEIISADSRQVYKGMNIGTGKDLDEYSLNGLAIPYHLIDIADAGEKYNISRFQHDFEDSVKRIEQRKKIPIVCGGTGLYIQAVLEGFAYTDIPVDLKLRDELNGMTTEQLSAELATSSSSFDEIADSSTRKRMIRGIEISRYLNKHPDAEEIVKSVSGYEYICFGLNPDVETRRRRISERLNDRLDNGLIGEVERLLKDGLSPDQLIYYGLEYKYVTQYLTGATTLDAMKRKLETEIHRFAKRQMTFFRKMEKDGISINWLSPAEKPDEQIDRIVAQYKFEK